MIGGPGFELKGSGSCAVRVSGGVWLCVHRASALVAEAGGGFAGLPPSVRFPGTERVALKNISLHRAEVGLPKSAHTISKKSERRSLCRVAKSARSENSAPQG